MHIKSIDISLQINILLLLTAFFLLLAYSYYIYKYTIPLVSKVLKALLILLRTFSLLFILLLIFEPGVTFTYKKTSEPKIFLFIDNSKSIAVKDSSNKLDKILSLIKKLKPINNNLKLITFGIKPKNIDINSLNEIKLNEPLTNFEKIISYINSSDDNAAAVVIVSDGIITEGANPIYQAEKLDSPIFTIGIGDTTTKKDIQIKDVIYNQIIYANKQTEIEAIISNTGFSNKSIVVSLFEENKLIQTKNVVLNESGLNKIKFDYTPQKEGETKLNILVSQLNEEENILNNKKSFFINILKDKIKVVLIGGCPSPDLSAISRILTENENIYISKFIQVTSNKFVDEVKISKIDSANVVVLIDFPSANTPLNIAEQIFSKIESSKKPFLISLSTCIDLSRLKKFENILPFTINKISTNNFQVTPSIIDNNFKSIFPKSIQENEWENLPPLTVSATDIVPKIGSNVIIKGTARNVSGSIPLMIVNTTMNQKSFAILAGEIWKWQLLSTDKNPYFLPNFIINTIRWLNTSEKQSQFIVNTSKKIYYRGEPVEFYAELYDNTFTPVDSANINLTIFSQNTKYNLQLEKIKSGLFYGRLDLNKSDNYFYEGTANIDGFYLKSKQGRFSITDFEIEHLNTKMDDNFLKQLAYYTNGNYFSIEETDQIVTKLADLIHKSSKEKIISSEVNLRTEKWYLIIIIVLFSLEWFIRKRFGMI